MIAVRAVRARAPAAALRQGRRPQHRRPGHGRRRPDARHVAHARRLGGPAQRIARAQAGCLLGDVDRETQVHGLADRARLRLADRHRRAHPGRRVRLPHAALGLDLGQRRRDGRRDRRRAAGARDAARRTPTSSGGCAAAAATSASSPASTTRSTPSVRRSSAASSPGPRARRPRCSSSTARSPSRRRPSSPWWRCCARRRPRPGCPKEHARQADRRDPRLPQREPRRGREGRRPDQVVRHARSATCWCAGPTRSCRRCSTRPSRRAGATTGRASTCPASSPPCARSHRAGREDPLAALGGDPVPDRRSPEPARRRALARRQPRRALRAQHRRRVGERGRRRGEHRVGARGVERAAVVLDRRHLRQLPDRGRGASSAPRRRWARRLPRLAEIKARWDPENVFRTNRNIPPA